MLPLSIMKMIINCRLASVQNVHSLQHLICFYIIQYGPFYIADTKQQPSTHAHILLIKLSLALKHFTLIKPVQLSHKSHDGAGFLSSKDVVSE